MSIDVVGRARSCVGGRFRMYGRSIVHGVDCVGLVGIAFDRRTLPDDYAPRGGTVEDMARRIEAAGLVPAAGNAPGELVLLDMGAGQKHLAVLTDRGFVHSDARLRMVVETPGPPTRPILGAWKEPG